MTIIARRASGGLGFDASTRITAAQAAELRTVYSWCWRTLPLPGLGAEVTADELSMLLSAGFEVLLYQRVRNPPWNPAEHEGSTDAATAANAALAAGYPRGAHLFCDWEGLAPDADILRCVHWLEMWQAQVISLGFLPGIYVGYQQPLSPLQLYDLHGFDQYATDPAHRAVAVRGCSIEQGREEIVAGVRIDVDTMAPDRLGDLPFVAAQGDEVA